MPILPFGSPPAPPPTPWKQDEDAAGHWLTNLDLLGPSHTATLGALQSGIASQSVYNFLGDVAGAVQFTTGGSSVTVNSTIAQVNFGTARGSSGYLAFAFGFFQNAGALNWFAGNVFPSTSHFFIFNESVLAANTTYIVGYFVLGGN